MTNQLPAHLQQYEAPDIGGKALANLGSAMPPHVSIGNGRFTLVDAANNEIMVPTFDPQIGPYLDAAIIDVADVKSRIYFEGAFDSTAEGKRPTCYSDNGVGPSMGSSVPQAPTCAACPRSEWTKVNQNGNKVPWCTEKYKIALLIPGFQTLFLLAVPPASHGPLREYIATSKGNGVNPANLVTRMWFASQGVLSFAPRPGGPAMAYIDAPTAALRQAAYAEHKTDSLVGRNDVARPAGAIAAPSAVMAIPQQAFQPGTPDTAIVHQPQGQWPVNQQGAPVQPQGVPQGQWVAAPQQPAQQWPAQTQQPGPQGQWPQQGTTQQVQPSGPFGATPAAGAGGLGWPQQNPAPIAATTSPSEAPAAGRRKRRTQAEIAAANGAAQQPAAGQQQAPFPHPGQQVQPSAPFAQTATAGAPTGTGAAFATGPATAPTQLEFGISQGIDAGANPEVKGMLDSFFGGQT